MARIKILTAANTLVALHVVGLGKAEIPFDGKHHHIDDALLPALDDSDVTYEIENVAEGSSEPDPAAGGDDGLGGSPSPLPLVEGEAPSAGGDVQPLGITTLASIARTDPPVPTPDTPVELPAFEQRDESEAPAGEANEIEAPANPLDHDGDGKAGGSLPGDKATAKKRTPRAKKPTA